MDSRGKERARREGCQYGGATVARYEGGLSLAGGEVSLHFTGIWVKATQNRQKEERKLLNWRFEG